MGLTMICPKCQTELPEGGNFCNECGQRLERVCPACGQKNPPGSKFCSECGESLAKPVAPASKPEPLKYVPRTDFNNPQSYTPKGIAEKILASRSAMEGERKQVTVLFSDVAGFTAMSEHLDPEEVHNIMEGCLNIFFEEIHRYEGAVVNFTGDGIMALFGAPLAHEDHARRAGLSALNIQKAIGPYGKKIRIRFGLDFQIRLGLNSGPVIVGSIGDNLKVEYTALGDTVNLASRMEKLASVGGIMVSGATYRLIRPYFELVARGPIQIKGKEEIQEAYELVREGKAETRMDASIARGLTRFIGRKQELDLMVQAYQKARAGSGQVVGIVGEAGVGKSRLLLEFRRSLSTGECTLLTGQCVQFGRNMAYLPLLDLLRSYFGLNDLADETQARQRLLEKIKELDEHLLVHLPSFQSLLSLPVENDRYRNLEPKDKRELDFEALRAFWGQVSRHRPLVLVVEDLHWMDKTSEQFLDLFIGGLHGFPILLLLLYRPEYSHPWGGKSYYLQIGLDHLPSSESADLISALLDEGKVAPELRNLILNRAAGNPLFMEEFTLNLVENGMIRRETDRYFLNPKAAEIQVPDTIQGIIAARMDRLSDNLKSTMQVASVIGRDFAYRILQSVMGVREELKAALLNLQGLELIYEKSLFPELEYIFKHAMTQEVAYNSLLVKIRQRLHEQIGRTIEELYAERLEEFYVMLAHHYGRSRNLEKGYEYLTRAGLQAKDTFANEEALSYFKRAWSLLEGMEDPETRESRRIETAVRMAEVLEPLGRFQEALKVLSEIISPAEPGKEDPRLARAYFCLGNNLSNLGQWTEARRNISRAIELAEMTNDQNVLGAAFHYLGQLDFFSGHLTSSVKNYEKAASIFETLENPFLMSWVYVFLANVISHFSYPPTRLAAIRKAEYWTEIAGNKRAEPFIHYSWFMHWIYSGTYDKALEHARQSGLASQKAGDYVHLGMGYFFQGWTYYLMGRFKEGLENAELSVHHSEKIGMKLILTFGLLLRGKIYMALGGLEEAERSVNQGMAIALAMDQGWAQIFGFGTEAQILARQNPAKSGPVREALGKAVPILRRARSWGYLLLHALDRADVYLVLGDVKQSAKEISRARRIYIKMEVPEGTPKLHSLEDRLRELSEKGEKGQH